MQQDVTLEQVLDLANNLSARDKVRLIALVAPQIERALAPASTKPLKSLYGLWGGLSVSEADISHVRSEMWGKFGEREF